VPTNTKITGDIMKRLSIPCPVCNKKTAIYEVVKKIIGEIRPIGETNTDEIRYRNLLEMIDLADAIMSEIWSVSHFKGRAEYSMSKAGKRAEQFLDDCKEELF